MDKDERTEAGKSDRVKIHILKRSRELLQLGVPGAHDAVDQFFRVHDTGTAEANSIRPDGCVTE